MSQEAAVKDDDFLAMSDDEVANMPFPPSSGEEPQVEEEEAAADSTEDVEATVDSEEVDEEELEEFSEDALDEEGDVENTENDPFDETGSSEEETEEEFTDTVETNPENVDYKAAYEEFFEPFRANGQDIQIHSIEDARKLMQMGANYHKKMAGMKPSMRVLRMLENNNLLDEDKLNYLIDLDKKNPAAINKLLQDSGIDPLELDQDENLEYTANNHTVSDEEVAFKEAIQDIQDTPSFETTLNIVRDKLDAASRQVLYKNPAGVKTINEHVQMGIYDQIMNIVQQERILGRLEDKNDLEAYQYVGTVLQENGAFDSMASPTESTQQHTPRTKVPTQDKQAEQKRSARKKAASSPKSTKSKSNKLPNDFNPLAMSDEEFEKFDLKQFS